MEVTQLRHQQDWKELRQTVCKEKLIIIFSLLQALITIFVYQMHWVLISSSRTNYLPIKKKKFENKL